MSARVGHKICKIGLKNAERIAWAVDEESEVNHGRMREMRCTDPI
jgi:hypothetical protein